MKGVNHHNMNETNKFILLKTIVTQGPISRVALSETTGLSKMTITAQINEYIQDGIVYECGTSFNTSPSTSGRKAKLLNVVADSILSLGIMIGRNHVKAGIIDLKGNVLISNRFSIDQVHNSDDFIKALYIICDSIISEHNRSKIRAIGISCMGPLNVDKGFIYAPVDFHDIHDIPVADKLKEKYDLPVFLEVDTCVSALAEIYYGNAQNCDNFFYIEVKAGLGGGMIINRQLYSGASGYANTIGHHIVEPNGLPCSCGQSGCLERYCSVRAILDWAKENGADDNLTWLGFLDRVNNQDPICMKAVDRLSYYLAIGIKNAIAFFDPAAIYIGGDLWPIQSLVIKKVKEYVFNGLYGLDNRPEIGIFSSKFPNNADFIGTAALVMEKYTQNKIEFCISGN